MKSIINLSLAFLIVVTAAFQHIIAENFNFVFLIFVSSLGLASVLLVERLFFKALVFIFTLLVLHYPVQLSPPEIVSASGSYRYTQLHSGDTLAYEYDIAPLARHEEECGTLKGTFIVVGRDLDQLSIEARGVDVVDQDIRPFYEKVDQVNLEFKPQSDTAGFTLRVAEGGTPRLSIGSEVALGTWYREGVYVVFENTQCRILFHALPKIHFAHESQ